MYGIKFGPNVTHLVLMFYLLLQMSFLNQISAVLRQVFSISSICSTDIELLLQNNKVCTLGR